MIRHLFTTARTSSPRVPVRRKVFKTKRGATPFAVIRVYDEAGNVIETHEHIGDFKELQTPFRRASCQFYKRLRQQLSN
jgi:hypothetical protein